MMAAAANSQRVTAAEDMRSRHYYQGGYDYDFVKDELDPKYECPICLLCQRDPHQTSCGHRFCYSCILTWLGEGKTCPKDNCSLGEGDLFPDPMAHREILQLFVKCPYHKQGCTSVMRLSDADAHVRQCTNRGSDQKEFQNQETAVKMVTSKPAVNSDANKRLSRQESLTCNSCGDLVDTGDQQAISSDHTGIGGGKRLICPNIEIACPFTSAGCTERMPRRAIQTHIQTQTQHHMQLLCEKLLKLHQAQGLGGQDQGEAEEAAAVASAASSTREEPAGLVATTASDGELSSSESSACRAVNHLRSSANSIHSTQKLLKELYQRQVHLEQKNRVLEIANEQLTQKLSRLTLQTREAAAGNLGRYCHGRFVWRIADFSDLHARMRNSHSSVLYSDDFYTSPFGYHMCLRCNVYIVDGEEHLGLFLHLLGGDNDDTLSWPFQGKVQVDIPNLQDEPALYKEEFSDTIDLNPLQHHSALNRPPPTARSQVGYGIQDFVRVNSLYSGGFVSKQNVLVIKVKVEVKKKHAENAH